MFGRVQGRRQALSKAHDFPLLLRLERGPECVELADVERAHIAP
jgi:hypothetical protein